MFVCTLAFTGMLACERKGAVVLASQHPLSVDIDTARGAANPSLVVRGFSSAELASLEARVSDGHWSSVIKINVAGHPETNVAGTYAVRDSSVVFVPRFPFDAGRTYAVRVNARALLPARTDTLSVVAMPRAAGNRTPVTFVRRVLPGSDSVPENLLRLYIEFSAPMSRVSGLAFIHLVDSSGREVPQAFLPLEADFWNDDLTRYTVFLDPGRVKRGILPNEQLGRAIHAGHRYALVVDAQWPDANGVPLTGTHRKTLIVGAPDESRIALDAWRILAPAARARAPLIVAFPKPLDHGLLKRAIGVETADGKPVSGTVDIANGEQEWRFTPSLPWRAGRYRVVVFDILEDVAGNRIDRAFEVDMFQRVDSSARPEQYRVEFTVR